MIRRPPRALALLALPLVFAVGACTEKLTTAGGCPALCPGQTLEIRDTVLDPVVVFDTTLAGFPLQGYESPLLLASRGDTLDVRPIIRFDTLTRYYTPTGDTLQRVVNVDSATLRVRIFRTAVKVPQTFFIDAYDVGDTTLADSLPSALEPFFVPSRLLGSVQVDSATFIDSATVTIHLDSAMVRTRVTTDDVLRIGLRLRSAESGMFYVTTSDDATNGPRLRYRVTADTAVAAISLTPSSAFPKAPVNVAGDYEDYQLVVRGTSPRASGRMAVGGLPALRSYLRFTLPARLTDSVAVVRARLELTQDPVRTVQATDSMNVRVGLVLATAATTDLTRAARLITGVGVLTGDSARVAPGDSGVVRIEMNAFLRAWGTVDGLRDIPQAIVLRTELEGIDPRGVRFFGATAAPALRPRLRVSYVENIRYGRP